MTIFIVNFPIKTVIFPQLFVRFLETFILNFPMKHCDFPINYETNYQRVVVLPQKVGAALSDVPDLGAQAFRMLLLGEPLGVCHVIWVNYNYPIKTSR